MLDVVETGRQINVLRGPKMDTHVRSTIIGRGERRLWISTVANSRELGPMETMVFDISRRSSIIPGPKGTYRIERYPGEDLEPTTAPELVEVVRSDYGNMREAINGHKRTIYAARRALLGKTYTPRPIIRSQDSEADYTYWGGLWEALVKRNPARSQVPEQFLLFYDLISMVKNAETEDPHANVNLAFQAAVEKAFVEKPDLKRSEVPEYLLPFYDHYKPNS